MKKRESCHQDSRIQSYNLTVRKGNTGSHGHGMGMPLISKASQPSAIAESSIPSNPSKAVMKSDSDLQSLQASPCRKSANAASASARIKNAFPPKPSAGRSKAVSQILYLILAIIPMASLTFPFIIAFQ